MDLALELCMPVEVLKHGTTERQIRQWSAYARRKMLPSRRIELYLAQIALLIAQTMGDGKRRFKLADFLFEPNVDDEADDMTEEEALAAAIEAFGFKPNAGGN